MSKTKLRQSAATGALVLSVVFAIAMMAGATFAQKLKKQAWGGRDFVVRDPDGNGICFVGPAA